MTAILTRRRSGARRGALADPALPTVTSATLRGWWRAGVLLGTLNDGDAVTTWADGTANGITLTAVGSPTFQTSELHGYPAVQLNGTSQYLNNTTETSQAQPLTVFVVARQTAVSGVRSLFNSNTGATTALFISGTGALSAFAGSTLTGPTASGNNGHILEAVFNTTTTTLNVDGGTATSGNAGTASKNTGIKIGTNVAASAEFFNGYLFEIAYYTGLLDSTDRAAVRTALATKYALTIT